MKPAVSVIIPTFDRTGHLKKALESVSLQTFRDFEVLVIQNGGLRTAETVVQEFSGAGMKVRYASLKRKGAAHARNHGISQASGHYLAFLDDDDLWYPDKLEKQVRRLEANPAVGLVSCQAAVCDPEGRRLEILPRQKIICDYRTLILQDVFLQIRSLSGVVIRRKCFEACGFFNPRYKNSDDLDFYLRLARSFQIEILPEPLYQYTWHHSNLSSYYRRGWMDMTRIFKTLPPLPEAGVDEKLLSESIRRYPKKIYMEAKQLYAEQKYFEAANRFYEAVRCDPSVGTYVDWRRSRLPLYTLLRPYGAMVYCLILSLRGTPSKSARFNPPPQTLIKPGTFGRGTEAKEAKKIPILICIDLEPDPNFTNPETPDPWKGCEASFDYMNGWRERLEKSTGSPVHFNWFLRMDPQVERTYGRADWGARLLESKMRPSLDRGDIVGLHTHGYRWLEDKKEWIIDHGNQEWINHCVRSSFRAFEKYFGHPCKYFRFGDRWMNNATMSELIKLGCAFDLTVEPGFPEMDSYHPEHLFSGTLPDTLKAPRVPYRPSLEDYQAPDPAGKTPLWEIPLSTGPTRERYRKYQTLFYFFFRREKLKTMNSTLSLFLRHSLFRPIAESLLNQDQAPYLAPIVRSDLFIKSHLLKRIEEHLNYFANHALARRFIFTTPERALKRMGHSVPLPKVPGQAEPGTFGRGTG